MTLTIGDFVFDHVVYDGDRDVLYLSVGEPREPARQLATADGHLVRYDAEGRVIGVTLVNAKWLVEREHTFEIPITIETGDLAPALV